MTEDVNRLVSKGQSVCLELPKDMNLPHFLVSIMILTVPFHLLHCHLENKPYPFSSSSYSFKLKPQHQDDCLKIVYGWTSKCNHPFAKPLLQLLSTPIISHKNFDEPTRFLIQISTETQQCVMNKELSLAGCSVLLSVLIISCWCAMC